MLSLNTQLDFVKQIKEKLLLMLFETLLPVMEMLI